MFSANNEYFVDVASRYVPLTFLPWAILCLAVVAARRKLLKSTYALVSLGLLVMLLAETGAFTLGPALVVATRRTWWADSPRPESRSISAPAR